MARTGKTKDEIKKFIEETFHYDLDRKIDHIRSIYKYDVSCQGSVPEAIIAFLESTDFENAIRLAISIGGDSDTIACITGGIAEAYYQTVPKYIMESVLKILPDELMKIIEDFSSAVLE
jgi:ADP-ribosylglycohydrolase